MARRRKSDPGAALLIVVGVVFAAVSQLFGCNSETQVSPPVAAVVAPQSASIEPQASKSVVPPAPAAPPQPSWRNVYITGHRVPIRSGPDAKSQIVDRVENGRLVVEYERRGDWVLVEHPITAKRGWVSARRISLSQPAGSDANEPAEEKPEIEKKPPRSARKLLTDAAIVALLIKASLAEYHSHAPCACPYDHDRRGRSCGARSAWSRPGGYSPLCYPKDVSKAAIAAYRERARAREADMAGEVSR